MNPVRLKMAFHPFEEIIVNLDRVLFISEVKREDGEAGTCKIWFGTEEKDCIVVTAKLGELASASGWGKSK